VALAKLVDGDEIPAVLLEKRLEILIRAFV
jgi:hypothetical protein